MQPKVILIRGEGMHQSQGLQGQPDLIALDLSVKIRSLLPDAESLFDLEAVLAVRAVNHLKGGLIIRKLADDILIIMNVPVYM